MIKKNLYSEKERCFILGTGPQINYIDFSMFDNEITIGVNLITKSNFIPNYVAIADTNVTNNHFDELFDKNGNEYSTKGDTQYVLVDGCLMRGDENPKDIGDCTTRPGCGCNFRQKDNLSNSKNVYTLKHNERFGIYSGYRGNYEDKLKNYYIDESFKTCTFYGTSVIDQLAIPLAMYLGFKKIYLLGVDGGWSQFYGGSKGDGKRHDDFNYKHVLPILEKNGVQLYNCDPSDKFEELDYVSITKLIWNNNLNLKDILNHPKLEQSEQMVQDINKDIIGRIALNKAIQATHILYIIKELMGNKCKKVLDIGTLWGGSMMTMMQSEYDSHFVSIDSFDGYYKVSTGLTEDPVCGGTNTIDSVTKNIDKHNKHNHPYDLVEGSSHDSEVINKVHSLLENSVDILFIDGDHTKVGVIKDWEDYSGLVKKGGIVVFDDYWSGNLAQHAWRHKDHWTEPKAMDIVGAFQEISEGESFKDNWIEIGLIEDKKIIERI